MGAHHVDAASTTLSIHDDRPIDFLKTRLRGHRNSGFNVGGWLLTVQVPPGHLASFRPGRDGQKSLVFNNTHQSVDLADMIWKHSMVFYGHGLSELISIRKKLISFAHQPAATSLISRFLDFNHF